MALFDLCLSISPILRLRWQCLQYMAHWLVTLMISLSG
jgi:hypothetical protein